MLKAGKKLVKVPEPKRVPNTGVNAPLFHVSGGGQRDHEVVEVLLVFPWQEGNSSDTGSNASRVPSYGIAGVT